MSILDDLIVFEMANSHQGSVEHGMAIIKEMGKIARINKVHAAVKLQYRDLNTFIHKDSRGRKDVPHVSRFEETRLEYDDFCILIESIRKEGLVPMSTPFDEKGVDWCVNQGIDVIKIASCSATDWPLLEKAAAAGKPLIVSTGGKTIEDIDNIFNFLTHRHCEFAFLHCVAEYPVDSENIQLDFMDRLYRRYPNVYIGYSGHEDPDDLSIPMMAIAKGARVMERHVGLPAEGITLNAYSMDPQQADRWVKAIIKARSICKLQGFGTRMVSQGEMDSLNSLARGCYVAHDIKAGDIISREDVYFAMPCHDGQVSSGRFRNLMTASRDYKADAPLNEIYKNSEIQELRSAIHDIKGLIHESNVVVGDFFELEISHHYGIRRFRQTGVAMVNIINREYCKKILVVLPGQSHPAHFHKLKEETFQLLYGDLEITVNGTGQEMRVGEIRTIQRNDMHSFRSRGGAVFEEISTTHKIADSYYDDPAIAGLDPMERKTIMKDW